MRHTTGDKKKEGAETPKGKRKEHEEEMLGSSSGLHGYTASLKKKEEGREFPARVVMLTRIRMEELMIRRKLNNYL